MKLIERWNKPMDKFWKKFQRICIILALVIPTTGELGEYLHFLPEGSISTTIKSIIGMLITLGIIIPKFTIANEQLKDKKE